jgi:hypothetical protein
VHVIALPGSTGLVGFETGNVSGISEEAFNVDHTREGCEDLMTCATAQGHKCQLGRYILPTTTAILCLANHHSSLNSAYGCHTRGEVITIPAGQLKSVIALLQKG